MQGPRDPRAAAQAEGGGEGRAGRILDRKEGGRRAQLLLPLLLQAVRRLPVCYFIHTAE